MLGIEFLPKDFASDKALLAKMLDGAMANFKDKASFVIIPKNPRKKASIDSILSSFILQNEFKKIEIIPTLSSAHIDMLELEAQLLSLKYAKFNSVALIGGDGKNHSGISGVELIKMARKNLGEGMRIITGSALDSEAKTIKRLEAKILAGADIFITQPAFISESTRKFLSAFNALKASSARKISLYLNIFGIFNKSVALGINNANLDFKIPQSYIDSMDRLGARECFWQNYLELKELAKEFNAGLYISCAKHNDLRLFSYELDCEK